MNTINNFQDHVFWGCPFCGRTVSCPNPSYYTPNLVCQCQMQNGFITQMVPLVPETKINKCKESKEKSCLKSNTRTSNAKI